MNMIIALDVAVCFVNPLHPHVLRNAVHAAWVRRELARFDWRESTGTKSLSYYGKLPLVPPRLAGDRLELALL